MSRRARLRDVAACLLLAGLVAACAGRSPGEPPPGVGSTTVEWAGMRVTWDLQRTADDRLRVRATVTNVGDATRERELPRCLNRLRLYRGDALVWDRAGTRDCFGLQWLRLEPAESRTFHTGLTAAEVLGDSLPAGEVTVRVYLPGRDRPGLPRADMELTLGRKLLRPG